MVFVISIGICKTSAQWIPARINKVVIASDAAGWLALPADEDKQLAKHIAAAAGFVSNIALWKESGPVNANSTKPLLHLWSLAVEEQFYIVRPLLVWIAWKRQLAFLTAMAAMAAMSFYLNVSLARVDGATAFCTRVVDGRRRRGRSRHVSPRWSAGPLTACPSVRQNVVHG